jgi:hypothetical protein
MSDPDREVFAKAVDFTYPDGTVVELPGGCFKASEYQKLFHEAEAKWRKATEEHKKAEEDEREAVRIALQQADASKNKQIAFHVNSSVIVKGLEKRADLNGAMGRIESLGKERAAVSFSQGKPVLVKYRNLVPSLQDQFGRVTIQEPSALTGEEASAALLEAKACQEKMLVARAAGDEQSAAGLALQALRASERAEKLLHMCPITPEATTGPASPKPKI